MRLIFLVCFIMFALFFSTVAKEGRAGTSATRYPLIFDDNAALENFGLFHFGGVDGSDRRWRWNKEKLRKRGYFRCYYYGDGGDALAVSANMLSFYNEKGFTLRSLCMGLISQIKFNPETGNRLPTYMLVDRENLALEPHLSIRGELPLSLPDCFSRGLPFSDCTWNYDSQTGRKLAASDTAVVKQLGERIEKFISGADCEFSVPGGVDPDSGKLERCGFLLLPLSAKESRALAIGRKAIKNYEIACFWDRSPDLPKGYGYAIGCSGEAGPSVSPEQVKAAMTTPTKPSSSIDIHALREIWGSASKNNTPDRGSAAKQR